MAKSFTQIATIEVGKLLSPLERLNNGQSVTEFINALGWDLGDFVFADEEIDLSNLVDHISGILDSITTIMESDDDETIASEVSELMGEIPPAISEISTAASTIESSLSGLSASDVTGINDFSVIPRRIFDYLVYQYLQRNHSKIFGVLHVLGIAEIVNDSADMPIRTINWPRIPTLFSNPKEIINEVYLWDSTFDGNKFLSRLEILLRAFLIPGGIYRQSDTIRTQLGRTADDDYEEIRIPLYQTGIWPDAYVELDLNLSPIPEKDGANKAGLFLYPYIFGALDINADLSEGWSLQLKGNADLGAGLGVEIRPPANLAVKTNILDTPGDFVDAYLDLSITKKSLKDQLFLIFGEQEGSRFGYKDIGFNLFLGQESGDFTLAVEALINELTLVIDGSQGDGFIQKVLSGIKLESISDITIGISNKEGFYFKGSSVLAITIPIHEQLGPIFLDSIKIGIGFGDEIKVILAVTFSLELGPIMGSVKEIGLELPMSFPDDNSGNLGPLNMDGVKFLPPSGAGLAIIAGGLSGGGYLEHDRENGSYAGILSLKFGEFALTAIGLINTRMPDGSFSLLVIITVEFSPEIQLSFGFSLKKVGGLIGIHRSIDSDFLREGLRAKTLGSILFPENPIQNAPKVISDISNGFPVYEGRFVVGPMVKIGWGGGIITADICVLIDLPSPYRIILLGQLNAKLPKPKNASSESSNASSESSQRKVLELNLDVLGEWDTGKGTLSIDATLYDSKILTFSLYGDSALRLKTGNNAYFGMSVGGFHPSFSPPPAFPSLRRLTLVLADKSYLKISCKMYMAITPNTLQFGSNLQLYAKFSGVTAEGHLTYDALFYFSPFSFIARMDAGVSVKYKGRSLASVDLDLTLSGPTPWNAAGEASFKIAFWEIDFDFDKTWGDSRKRLLDDVNPLTPLKNDLKEDSSWGVSLMGIRNFESFKINQSDENGEETEEILFMHPAGMLEVREKVLPLNNKLDLYGGAKVKEYNKFTITELTISYNGGSGTPKIVDTDYVNEEFATAQYFNKTEQQKLSQPSFESKPGGVIPAAPGLKQTDAYKYQPVKFENILIDEDRVSRRSTNFPLHPWHRASNDLRLARAERSVALGSTVRGGLAPYVSVAEERFFLADGNTHELFSASGNTGLSFTSASQLMDELLAESPSDMGNIEIVPAHDLEMEI